MRLALIGLGKMGYNMTLRLHEGGHEVVAVDRNAELARELATKGAIFGENAGDAIAKLSAPRVVWVMVPSQVTDAVIQDVAGRLSKGDVIIDGGNSNWKDSRARAEKLAEKGILFCDAGTSGGVWGLKNGYCLMVGGAPEAVKICEPILQDARARGRLRARRPCRRGALREDGAQRHRVRPDAGVRRGLRDHEDRALQARPPQDRGTSGATARSSAPGCSSCSRPRSRTTAISHAIKGWVEDSGEGRWTVQAAIDQDVPAPIITLSLQTRFRSRQDESYGAKILAALRNQFGGHAVKKE